MSDKPMQFGPIKVLVIGPDVALKGGVASVIKDMMDESHKTSEVEYQLVPTIRATSKLLYPFDYLDFLVRLIRITFSKRVDMAHVHLSSRGSTYRKLWAMAVLRFTKTPYVVHLHGSKFDMFYNSCPAFLKARIAAGLSEAHTVVALSEVWGNWLRSALGLGNVSIIHNGTRDVRRTKVNAVAGPFVFLFGGKLEPRKGVDVLLAAFAQLKGAQRATLLLVGHGEITRYKAEAAKLGLGANVQFLGWKNYDAYDALLSQAMVFVLPSRHEGMPMSIIEAMSAGLAVIATDVGGIPELVQSKSNGLLVKPGDVEALVAAMQEMLDNPELANRFGLAGRSVYEGGFSSGRMFAEFRALYGEVVRKTAEVQARVQSK